MKLSSKIDMHNGVPALFVNRQPVVSVMCEGDGEFEHSFKSADIHIYKRGSQQPRRFMSMGWDGADNFDYSKDEEMMARTFEKDPDGYLMPYVGHIEKVPDLWQENNPDEITLLSNGELGDGPSSASEKFAIISDDLITRYIEHFENSIYGERIIGYHVVNGRSYEWLSWNWLNKRTAGHELAFDDYSEPMLKEFRRWLREKYSDDVDALRDSWRNAQVTFEKVCVPTLDQRFGDYGNILSHESEGLQVFDYYSCYADSWAKLAMRFCDTVADSLEVMKRDIGVSLTHGCSYYWFDMLNHVYEGNGAHWYDHPEKQEGAY